MERATTAHVVAALLLLLGGVALAEDESLDEKNAFEPFRIPWRNDMKYTAVNRAHNWCPNVSAIIHSRETDKFQRALNGQNVSVIIMNGHSPDWVVYDRETGFITGGYIPKIMDEVARRTGLSWRASVAVVDPPNSSERLPWGGRESYDTWLHWGAENYDIIAGAYANTVERRLQGIRFGFPFMDSSPVLVGVVRTLGPPWFEKWFSFVLPFSLGVWAMILISMAVTAAIYYFLEQAQGDFDFEYGPKGARPSEELVEEPDTPEVTKKHVVHAIWLSFGSFTQAATFSPKSFVAKLYILSWTFTILLLVSSYTASLATFLISENSKTMMISGLEDAIDKRVPVCVYRGGAFDDYLAGRYPDLLLYRPQHWGYHNLREKKCVALVKDAFYFELDQHKVQKNGDCDLDIIGRPILRVSSSFIGSVGCSTLAMDVIDQAMQEMDNEGWFEREQAKFVEEQTDFTCSDELMDTQQNGADPMFLDTTMGIFFFHAVAALVCLVAKVIVDPTVLTKFRLC